MVIGQVWDMGTRMRSMNGPHRPVDPYSCTCLRLQRTELLCSRLVCMLTALHRCIFAWRCSAAAVGGATVGAIESIDIVPLGPSHVPLHTRSNPFPADAEVRKLG